MEFEDSSESFGEKVFVQQALNYFVEDFSSYYGLAVGRRGMHPSPGNTEGHAYVGVKSNTSQFDREFIWKYGSGLTTPLAFLTFSYSDMRGDSSLAGVHMIFPPSLEGVAGDERSLRRGLEVFEALKDWGLRHIHPSWEDRGFSLSSPLPESRRGCFLVLSEDVWMPQEERVGS